MAVVQEISPCDEKIGHSVKQLTNPIVGDVAISLKRSNLDKSSREPLLKRVSNLTLYKAFFEEELVKKITAKDVTGIDVDAKIPSDVKENARMITLLKAMARRIEHMQMPRYHSLKKILVDVVEQYLQTEREV